MLLFLAAAVPGVTLGERTQVVTAGQRLCGVGERSGKALGCALELAGFGKGESGRDNNHRGDVGGGEPAVPMRSENQSVAGARRRAVAANRLSEQLIKAGLCRQVEKQAANPALYRALLPIGPPTPERPMLSPTSVLHLPFSHSPFLDQQTFVQTRGEDKFCLAFWRPTSCSI